ncbi:MAG: chorismate mutase [Gemmatimonadetes bacterium]|nr:chorismate mutase [Gemmatimonadota bacterium]
MTAARQADPVLAKLRADLEVLDGEIVRLVALRVETARAIGAHKRAAGVPTLDAPREAAVIRRAAAAARDAALPEEPLRAIFWQLVELCRRAQEEV